MAAENKVCPGDTGNRDRAWPIPLRKRQASFAETIPSRDGEEKPSDRRSPKKPTHVRSVTTFAKEDT